MPDLSAVLAIVTRYGRLLEAADAPAPRVAIELVLDDAVVLEREKFPAAYAALPADAVVIGVVHRDAGGFLMLLADGPGLEAAVAGTFALALLAIGAQAPAGHVGAVLASGDVVVTVNASPAWGAAVAGLVRLGRETLPGDGTPALAGHSFAAAIAANLRGQEGPYRSASDLSGETMRGYGRAMQFLALAEDAARLEQAGNTQ